MGGGGSPPVLCREPLLGLLAILLISSLSPLGSWATPALLLPAAAAVVGLGEAAAETGTGGGFHTLIAGMLLLLDIVEEGGGML